MRNYDGLDVPPHAAMEYSAIIINAQTDSSHGKTSKAIIQRRINWAHSPCSCAAKLYLRLSLLHKECEGQHH
ncbi:MAG: hypothetical protein GX096_03945 [Clostridiales bacterium]|nr:hypothetical protein [Clostridiales bacterium]